MTLNIIVSKTKNLKTKFKMDESLGISAFTYANSIEIKATF